MLRYIVVQLSRIKFNNSFWFFDQRSTTLEQHLKTFDLTVNSTIIVAAKVALPSFLPQLQQWLSVYCLRSAVVASMSTLCSRPQRQMLQQLVAVYKCCITYMLIHYCCTYMLFTELLKTHKLSHRSVHIQPRGLTNRGNWCYVNAVSFMHTEHSAQSVIHHMYSAICQFKTLLMCCFNTSLSEVHAILHFICHCQNVVHFSLNFQLCFI